MLKKLGILSFSGFIFLSACGQKNDAPETGNTILAVRTFAEGQQIGGAERTQVALLKGDFESAEDVQAAAAEARWISVDQFAQDDELAFEEVTENTELRQPWDDDFERPRNRNCRGERRCTPRRGDGGWRPYRSRDPFIGVRWVEPSHRFYGFDRCGYRYISHRGRCVRPISRRYSNYGWQHRWGWTTQVVYRRRGDQTRVRIRFYF